MADQSRAGRQTLRSKITIMGAILAWAATGAAGRSDTRAAETLDPRADERSAVVAGNARFTLLTPGLVRIEWSPDGTFEDRASQVVVNRRMPTPRFERREETSLRATTQPADAHAGSDAPVIVLRTDRIELRHRPDGQPLGPENLVVRARIGPGDTWFETAPPFAQCRNVAGKGPNLGSTVRTLDGVSGACAIPDGILSRNGWYCLDDSATLVFDDGPDPWIAPRRNKDATDWYFFAYGSDYKQALRDFTAVAGRIPLPPRYVFGTWWSRYWAYSDAELRQLVEEFDRHEVPLDVLVIDMDWHLDGWTGYTWNPQYFPEPEKFLQWCKARGLKITLNLHPAEGVGKHEKAFPEMARAMGLDPGKVDRVPFDCTDRGFVDAYFKCLHHPLEAMGVDFWWMDWQQGTQSKIPGLDPLYWLNVLHWRDMQRREEQTGRRPLIFSRWGGLGNHRYQIGFSGDTFCNWESLAFQPHFTATAGNVGYAYWSHDIGGHQPGKVDPELYARWIQWGALSPILRTHTTKNPEAERRIWAFPEPVFHAARDAMRLRYELIPYIYTMARKCYDTSLPLCRPLYYEWPDLDVAYQHPGQYLFGDDMLVAPVCAPIDPALGCAPVKVWIPPGRWRHWFTGRTYEGPRMAYMPVPLDEIPLFAREGAIIPAMPRVARSDHRPDAPLVLHLFPGGNGGTRVYEDDGLSSAYQKNECARTPIAMTPDGLAAGDARSAAAHDSRHGTALQVDIGPVEGRYAGMPEERVYELRVHGVPPPETVAAAGRPLKLETLREGPGWLYDAEQSTLIVRTAAAAASAPLRVEMRFPPLREAHDAWTSGVLGLHRTLAVARQALNGRLSPLLTASLRAAALTGPLDASSAAELAALRDRVFPLALEIDRSSLPEAQRRELISRLLGIYAMLRLDFDPDDSGRTAAAAELALDPPLGAGLDVRSSIRLQIPANWRSDSPDDSIVHAGAANGLLSLRVPLRGDGALDTTVLRAQLTLEKDGQTITLPLERTLLPSINAWWICGPFPSSYRDGLNPGFEPEQTIDLKAAYTGKDDKTVTWRKAERPMTPDADPSQEFFVHLGRFYGGRVHDAIAYAVTYLHAPRDMNAVLAVGSDDGVAVWLNGERIHFNPSWRPYMSRQDRVPMRLREGANTLMLKVNTSGGDWGFGAHVETEDGRPLPEVRARLTP